MNTRSDLYRQRQVMRQRIRAVITARRIAVATALAEAEVSSADQPTS
ncbi:hypothetical protein [Catelliglobosispora koreensis]|nr:hypothetical protein [Catelliglobosispora koreensis]